MTRVIDIQKLIDDLSDVERKEILQYLRALLPTHPVEKKLMASAETILDAISRSTDLTVRGIEGIIAEAAFATETIPTLTGWAEKIITGDQPYDFLLDDGKGEIRVQVKMQRRIERRPLMASEIQKKKNWPPVYFVVETQRTRGGTSAGNEKTRPYRFGDFDILAVSMGASKGRWSSFMYTLSQWLIPSEEDAKLIYTYQPVPPATNEFWTDDFITCVYWLRQGEKKRIEG